ncbi:tetratricopeptide repeat protein [Rahnella sp. PD4]|uniref:tetratricopeptide repeat protein n=1 Tax=Rahnella sp. PD4 TaxID=3368611 RepID=UPI003BA36388
MIAAVPKSLEFGNKLVDILSSKQKLGEIELHRWIRDIKSLKDYANESYLLAMAYAAGGKKEKAILYFERCLSNDEDGVSATNYITFIASEGNVEEYLKVSAKLAEMYVSRELYGYAYYMHLHCGKLNEAIDYANKFIKVSPNGEDEFMQQQVAYLTRSLKEFKELAHISDAKFELIAGSMANIMRKHNASSVLHLFHTVREESVNAYVITIPDIDLEEIAQMNYELAFELAEHDELLGIQVSAWFEMELAAEEKESALNYMDKQ